MVFNIDYSLILNNTKQLKLHYNCEVSVLFVLLETQVQVYIFYRLDVTKYQCGEPNS